MQTEEIKMTEQKCDFCQQNFKIGELFDNLGSTFEDGTRENYFVHSSCRDKSMNEFRQKQPVKCKRCQCEIKTEVGDQLCAECWSTG